MRSASTRFSEMVGAGCENSGGNRGGRGENHGGSGGPESDGQNDFSVSDAGHRSSRQSATPAIVV